MVVNALLSQKDKLATEYAQLPATVSQAFEQLVTRRIPRLSVAIEVAIRRAQ
ncbi:hypothetical protein AB9X41_18375 [Ralstonia solanacearum]